MTRKKSKFLTFCCSLIPGAGEMYLGFLKQGISIMAAFGAVYVVGGIIFPPLTTFCAVIWFYSFFHTHNLNSLPDEEFYAIQDDFLIHASQLADGKTVLLNQYRKLTAAVLILLGISIILNNVNDFIFYFAYDIIRLPDSVLDLMSWFSRRLPQTIAAVAIIIAGSCLIRNKKQELDESISLPPGLPMEEAVPESDEGASPGEKPETDAAT